ncbi:MAG TPA: SDR family oxidoreductase [Roseiarcus sp.]|nr:SDR family oxidoreductase [Roseiarcus sp.]
MASPAASSNARLVIPDLADKVVLVTGASTGIGAAVARGFGAQGARVAVHYHSSAKEAEAVLSDLGGASHKAIIVKGDLSDPGQCAAIVEQTARHFGRIDGLINNAGLMLGRVNSLEASDEHFSKVFDLNARSVFAATRAAAPWLSKQGGFVINTTSIAARNGGAAGAILYAAAKGFVSTLTHGQAKELIGKKVRVNGVAPGVITTPFHERYTTPEQLETIRLGIPAQRLGVAEDCVGVYLFLASEALSGYIVGQIIEVNGGQLMP